MLLSDTGIFCSSCLFGILYGILELVLRRGQSLRAFSRRGYVSFTFHGKELRGAPCSVYWQGQRGMVVGWSLAIVEVLVQGVELMGFVKSSRVRSKAFIARARLGSGVSGISRWWTEGFRCNPGGSQRVGLEKLCRQAAKGGCFSQVALQRLAVE